MNNHHALVAEPPTDISITAASSAFNGALRATLELLSSQPHLRAPLSLPEYVTQFLASQSSSSNIAPLLPTAVFVDESPRLERMQIFYLERPHLTSILPAFARERDALLHENANALTTPVTLFVSQLASHIKSIAPIPPTLIIIHCTPDEVCIPPLPFVAKLCEPKQLCLVDGEPHYLPNADASPVRIELASLELSVNQVTRLSAQSRAVVVALAERNVLLADIALATLAEDALLLRFIREHLDILRLDVCERVMLRAFLAPTLSVVPQLEVYLSQNAESLSATGTFLVRPRFSGDDEDSETHFHSLPSVQSLLTTVSALSMSQSPELVMQALYKEDGPPDSVKLPLWVNHVHCGIATFACLPSWNLCMERPILEEDETYITAENLPPAEEVQYIDGTPRIVEASCDRLWIRDWHTLRAQDVLSALSRTRPLFVTLPVAPTVDEVSSYVEDRLLASAMHWCRMDWVLTNCSWTFGASARQPPRVVAVSNNSDVEGTRVFAVTLISVRDVVDALDDRSRHILQTVRVKWLSYPADDTFVLAPVLMSSSRARFDIPNMSTDHLDEHERLEFIAALEAFKSLTENFSLMRRITVAAPGVLMFDNHAFLHGMDPELYGENDGSIEYVGFDLPLALDVYRFFQDASRYPLRGKEILRSRCP